MCTNEVPVMDKSLFDCMDLKQAFDSPVEEKMKILVFGITGVGKSTLLNTLLGKEVFEVGGPGTKTLDAVTTAVTSVCTSIQGFHFEIFDSPGLQDGSDNDRKYLDDMHKECNDVNLVIYCIDMTITRSDEDSKTVELFTETFGPDMWKKTILVLTKANMLRPATAGYDERSLCKNTFDTLEEKLKDKLTQLGVPKEVTTNIPAVAAGSDNERYIPYVSKKITGESTHRRQNFLLELWVTCFERLSSHCRNSFINETGFHRRLEVSKDCLPPEERELLEEEKRKNEEDKKAHEERQKALNEQKASLSIQPCQPTVVPPQQPPPQVSRRTVITIKYGTSSADCCLQ